MRLQRNEGRYPSGEHGGVVEHCDGCLEKAP